MPSKLRIRSSNRVRAYKPRVRTGCITCRIRHVKCDETKPSCQKCTSTGRKCDGYLDIPSSANKSFLPITISETRPLGNDLELRSLDFFCKRTVVMLSGNFDQTFWTRLILQAAHHEPAIRHAVIALGSLHECFGYEHKDSVFAVQQYSKAIRALVKPLGESKMQTVDVTLATCVLFVCFELMRGNHSAAISHIEGGAKILSETRPKAISLKTWSNCNTPYISPPIVSPLLVGLERQTYSSDRPYVPPSILNPIFARLDLQAWAISSTRQLFPFDHILDSPNTSIPANFLTLEDARNSLDQMRAHSLRYVKDASTEPDFIDPVKRRLNLGVLRDSFFVKLQQWSSAFQSFEKRIEKFSVENQEAIHVLLMHWIVMSINTVIDEELHFADPMMADGYQHKYEEIIAHATAVAELSTSSSKYDGRGRGSKGTRAFNMDPGISFPLTFVAGACRDGATRWKAVEILRALDRQEGLVNTLLCAGVAERMIQIEEDGLVPEEGGFLKAYQIPREKRSRSLYLSRSKSLHLPPVRYQQLRSLGLLPALIS